MIQNAALEDERLSYKARGLLAYLLSRPPGWTTSADRLAKDSPKEGRDAVLSGLKELEVIGYLHRETKSGGRGKWTHNQTVLDVPVPPSDQEVIATGLDDSVKYDAVKPGLTNKTEPNNNDFNKNESSTSVGETEIPTSPAPDPDKEFLLSLGKTDSVEHPDWLTHEQAELATRTLSHAGLTLQDGIDTYEASSAYNGKHDSRMFGQWVGIVTRLTIEGKEIPKRPVITVDTAETMEAAFNQFWEAFPKKERRAVAIAAFRAAVKKVPASMLISGALNYARSVKLNNTEDQYVAMPHNWLNDERWTDQHKGKSWSHTAADD
jgi:hypothetical protein